MADTLDYGAGVSRTLQTTSRAFSTIIWQQGKPPLDSELNLQFDISEDYRKRFADNFMQSGFVACDDLVFNAAWENYFKVPTDIAFVNGWQIDVNASGDETVTLGAAPTGLGNQRYDFIFLEVWKAPLTGGSAVNKPSTTEIYKDGNVQNAVATLADDIEDPVIGFETTKRVQIQYRFRVQEDVAAPNGQASNIFDATTYAQGAEAAPVSPWDFSNMGATTGDDGLWRAGAGDAASVAQLGTVDGYVYAIPVAIIFRRAIAAYNDEDADGQKASNTAIASGTSDRIDGLFYDSVAISDTLDIRHSTVFDKAQYEDILKTAIENLFTNQNKQIKTSTIAYELIADASIPGYTIFNSTVADKVRSEWSDLQTTKVSYVAKLNVGDTDTNQDWYTDRATGSWASADTIVVDAPNGSPTGTIILGTDDSDPATKPLVFYNDAGLTDVAGAWTGTGTTSATFTLGTNASLTNQEIWVVFDVQYPSNQGLTNTPDQLDKLEYKNSASFPVVPASYTTYYGVVRAATDLMDTDKYLSRNSKQVAYTHDCSINPLGTNYTLTARQKSLDVTPILSSTDAIDSANKVMSVTNYDTGTNYVRLPMPTTKLWFLRGVYKTASGGFTEEIATTQFINQNPGSVVDNSFFSGNAGQSYCAITSMIYDPGGANTQLIAGSGGSYYPVFRHNASDDVDEFILVDSSGVEYVPPTTVVTMYQITGTDIPTANVNAYNVDSDDPDDNWIQCDNHGGTVADGQELWFDIDYFGEPHDGAQIKIAYEYTPYQGLVDGIGTILSAQLKSMCGFVHTDGIGNVTDNIDKTKYIKQLISYLPTPADVEFSVIGGAVAGSGLVGKHLAVATPYTFADNTDLSNADDQPLRIDDTVTAAYNAGLNAVERGGNDATDAKAISLRPMDAPAYKQAVLFGLAVAGDNFDLNNELVLYAVTNTVSDDVNEFISGNGTTIGVDFYFIKKRPLIKRQ